jgi:hypothetical protein
MKIDNFEIIKQLLNFTDPKTMYIIQIIQRKKDLPELNKSSKMIHCYYIRSMQQFDEVKQKNANLKLPGHI